MGDLHDRRDDWRTGVDERLTSLTSCQRTTDDQLDDLDLKYEAIDKLLRGDAEQDTDGLIARLHRQENALLEFRAELNPKLKDLKDEISALRVEVKEKHEQRIKDLEAGTGIRGIKWQVLGMILVAVISAGGLRYLLTNLTKIRGWFKPTDVQYHPDKQLLREIQRDKERQKRLRAKNTIHPRIAPPLGSSPNPQAQGNPPSDVTKESPEKHPE